MDDFIISVILALTNISVFCRSKTFFTLARKEKLEWKKEQFDAICAEYDEVVHEADEKVQISVQMHDYMERHLKRLDQELQKFNLELEADTAGLTEILEQRSYLLDHPPSPEKTLMSAGQKRSRHTAMDPDYNGDLLDEYGPSSPIAPGRRTRNRGSRFKNNYTLFTVSSEGEGESIEGDDSSVLSPARLYQGSGGKPPLMPVSQPESKARRRNNPVQQMEYVLEEDLPMAEQPVPEWIITDPEEPRYCLCNQVSYGEMVACDNPDCMIEWFHYGCVGITAPPKGKWYCPTCSNLKKKRRQ